MGIREKKFEKKRKKGSCKIVVQSSKVCFVSREMIMIATTTSTQAHVIFWLFDNEYIMTKSSATRSPKDHVFFVPV